MQPLRVVAVMASPVLVTVGLPMLDGPLSMGAFRLMTPEQQATLPDLRVVDWAEDMDLPLDRWLVDVPVLPGADRRLFAEINGDRGLIWGWKCSQGQPVGASGMTRYPVRQRAPMDAYRDFTDKRTINTSAGSFKPHDLCYPAVTAREIEWYAIGDLGRVRACLEQVTSIGKHHNVGRGKMVEWRVEPSEDVDRWLERPMPASDGVGTWRAIRAPYYRPERRYPCR